MFRILKSIPSLLKEVGKRSAWEEQVWRDFVRHLHGIDSEKDLFDTLDLLVSRRDRRVILSRLTVISRLNEGFSYRKIQGDFGISPQTISAIKKSFEANGYVAYGDQVKDPSKRKYRGGWSTNKERKTPRRIKKTKYGDVRIY